MPRARIVIDEGACIGSGHCALTAPDLFSLDEEGGVAVARVAELSDPARIAEAEEAAAGCPAWAITVEDSG